MQTSKIWAIIQWGLGGFILLLSLVAFSTKGGILSGLLFLLLAVLVSPLRKKILALLPVAFPKMIVIISGIVLFFASFLTFPSSETTQLEGNTAEEVVERSMPSVESEEMVGESNIQSLSFSSSKDIEVQEGKDVSDGYVLAKVNDKNAFFEDDVTFVSGNSEIATIEYSRTALSNYLYYTVNGIAAGETEVYAVSKDGKVESEHKKVVVKVDEEKLAKEKAEAEKKAAEEEQKKAEEEAEKKAEEEKLAKEKEEAETKAAQETKSTSEQAANTAAVAVPQQTENSSGNDAGGGGNGDSFNTYDIPEQQNTEASYVLNTKTHKFHKPSCNDVKKIKPENYGTSSSSRDELMSQGYSPCGHCNP